MSVGEFKQNQVSCGISTTQNMLKQLNRNYWILFIVFRNSFPWFHWLSLNFRHLWILYFMFAVAVNLGEGNLLGADEPWKVGSTDHVRCTRFDKMSPVQCLSCQCGLCKGLCPESLIRLSFVHWNDTCIQFLKIILKFCEYFQEIEFLKVFEMNADNPDNIIIPRLFFILVL